MAAVVAKRAGKAAVGRAVDYIGAQANKRGLGDNALFQAGLSMAKNKAEGMLGGGQGQWNVPDRVLKRSAGRGNLLGLYRHIVRQYFNGSDLDRTSTTQLNGVRTVLLGAEWRGAVDRVSSPAPDGNDHLRNSAVAPHPGHWVAFYRSGTDNRLITTLTVSASRTCTIFETVHGRNRVTRRIESSSLVSWAMSVR